MNNDGFVDWADGEDDDGGGLGDEYSFGEEGEDDSNEDQAEDFEDPGPQSPEDSAMRSSPASAPRKPVVSSPRRKRASRARRVFRAAKKAHMKLSPTAYAYQAAVGVGADPCIECGAEVTFDLYRTGKGFSAVLRIPTDNPGRAIAMATSPSSTKKIAVNKGVNMARAASASPLVQSVVPPQTRLALKAMNNPIAKGLLRKAVSR